VNGWKPSRDQEVYRLGEESSTAEVGGRVDEHDGEGPLPIRAFETVKVGPPLVLRVILFPDDLDQVGQACIGIVILAVDERHYFVRFLELMLVD
jgi:hypothetical protein